MQITFILSMVFAVVIALFAVANSEPVGINLIFWSFELSQAVVILVSAVVGAVVVFLLSLVSKAKGAVRTKGISKELSQVKKQLEACQKELADCRLQLAAEEHPAPTPQAEQTEQS